MHLNHSSHLQEVITMAACVLVRDVSRSAAAMILIMWKVNVHIFLQSESLQPDILSRNEMKCNLANAILRFPKIIQSADGFDAIVCVN